MSLLPMYKLCRNCGAYISFNPDVGKNALTCPKCHKPLLGPPEIALPGRSTDFSLWNQLHKKEKP